MEIYIGCADAVKSGDRAHRWSHSPFAKGLNMSYVTGASNRFVSLECNLPPRVELDSTRQTLAWQARPLEFLHDCAQRYGEAFTLDLGSHGLYVMFADPESIRTIFNANNTDLYAGRGNRVLEPLLGARSLLLLEEQRHIRERRLLLPGLHAQVVEHYGERIQSAALEVMAASDAHEFEAGAEFAIQPLMQAISVRIILQAVLGIHSGPRFEALSEQVQSVLNDPKLNLGLLDQLQNDLASPAWHALRCSLKRIDAMLLYEIDLRRRQTDAGKSDLLSIFLAATCDDGTALDDLAVRDELMTLIVTGYETTATALAWAFYWLAREPAKLDCLRQELAPLGRKPSVTRLARGSYLQAVCQETLRIRPVIPVVAREVQAPVSIGRYLLPPGVTVAACIYLAHHRADAFPEPEKFRPERFLHGQPSPWEYLPFGGGVRRCIGASLALFEMKIVLGSILAHYDVAPLQRELRTVRRFVTIAPEGGAKLRISARQ
jgi:cytochrome P450